MRTVALVIALLVVAVGAGLAAGAVALMASSAVLPPFGPEDGDTVREFVPVALAYLTWGGTTLALVLLGVRRMIGAA
jgi:hypothetical protein